MNWAELSSCGWRSMECCRWLRCFPRSCQRSTGSYFPGYNQRLTPSSNRQLCDQREKEHTWLGSLSEREAPLASSGRGGLTLSLVSNDIADGTAVARNETYGIYLPA